MRCLNADWPAIYEDLAGVGLIDAVEDPHQGGFAGAVLSNQRVDLSRSQRQINTVESLDTWKGL